MAESAAEAKARVDRVLAWVYRIVDAPDADVTIEQLEAMTFDESLTRDDRRNVLSLIRYELVRREDRRRLQAGPHRRAMALLRSYLSAEQQHSLRQRTYFHVQGSDGGTYRLCLRTGAVQRVERRGSRWYWIATFCWHDFAEDAPDKKRLPLPDLALQQMLWLRCDEPGFMANANLSIESRRVEQQPWVLQMRRLTNERRVLDQPAPPVNRPVLHVCLDEEMAA